MPVKTMGQSKSFTTNKPHKSNTTNTAIINKPYSITDRYFPIIIWKFVIGEEYSSLMEPLLKSRLTNPIVNNGI